MEKTFLFQVNVTRDCNLRCTHCYISSDKKAASKKMTDSHFVQTFKQIADFLNRDWVGEKRYNFAEIHVIGGEPTMLGYDFFNESLPMIKEIMSTVKQSYRIGIVTNLVSNESVKVAALFDEVSTSYEFDTRFILKSGKEKPELELKWLENVNKLRAIGKDVGLTMAVTKQAVNYGAQYVLNHFYENGFKRVHLGFFIPSGDGLVYMDSVFPTFSETTNFMIEATKWYLDRRISDPDLFINPIESMIKSIYDDAPIDDIICPIISGSLDVDWDGETVTCIEAGGEIDMKSLGNIFKSSISDVLDSPQYRREKAKAVITKPFCIGCDELTSCQSACGILHEYWNGKGECPGFKGFIKHVRHEVSVNKIKPKDLILMEGGLRGC